MPKTASPTMPLTEIDDTHVAAAHHAIAVSLVGGLEAHLDALADTLAEKQGVDVEIARVLLARELAEASQAIRQVAVGRAIARGRTPKNIAVASGASYANALYAKFPHARSVSETTKGVELSKTARRVVVDGWGFVIRARA